MKYYLTVVLPLALSGCATTTFHEDLMTPQQLAAADCRALATEQKKVEENAAHLKENGNGAALGAAWLIALDAMSMQRGMANSGYQSGLKSAETSDNIKAASAEAARKAEIITMFRARKGCA